MKVCHISAARSWRGGEQQLAWLLHILDQIGVDQQLLCPDGSPLHRWVISHMPHISIIPYWKRTPFDPFTAQLIKNASNTFKANLIHAHDAHAHTMAWMAASLWKHTLPVIVSRRVSFPPSNNLITRKKYYHKSIRRVLCVSQFVANVLIHWGMPRSQLEVVYDGIDLDRFDKQDRNQLRQLLGTSKETPLVGYIGALTSEKNVVTLFKAVAQLKLDYPTLQLVLIGEGPLRAQLEKYSQQLAIHRCIHWLGFREDVAKLLPGLDILVLPSQVEGLGTTLLDAMAARVAVVASNTGGIPEIVLDRETGLLAPPAQTDVFAQQIKCLLDQPAFRQQLIHRAAQWVRSFSKEQMAQHTLACYQAIS